MEDFKEIVNFLDVGILELSARQCRVSVRELKSNAGIVDFKEEVKSRSQGTGVMEKEYILGRQLRDSNHMVMQFKGCYFELILCEPI